MAKILRANVPSVLTSRNYTNNGAQLITGLLGNAMFKDIADSTVWYDERLKAKIFPYEIENVAVGVPSSPVVGKYYLQRSFTGSPSGTVFANVQYNDIIEWDGSSLWQTVSIFDREEDWVIYSKGDPNAEEGENWLYSYKDVNPYSAYTGEWLNIGVNKIVPHNYSLYKQGGIPGEYYHMTAAEHTSLANIGNSIILFDTREVAEAFPLSTGPVMPPSAGLYYLIETSSGSGKWVLNLYNGSIYQPATTTKNTYIYCILNTHLYEYDKVSGFHIDAGIFKHSVHNNQKELQGGTTGEYYHLTQAEYSALTATGDFEYYEFIIQEVAVSSYTVGTYSDGDYVVLQSETSTQGVKIYKQVLGAWQPVLPALDKRTYIINNSDQHVWVFNKATNLFEDKGKPILAFHNNIQGLQGGTATERYHLNAGMYANIDALEYDVAVYVDSLAGDDTTNDGLTLGAPIKTATRLAEILQYRNIVNLTIYNKSLGNNIGTFIFNEALEKVLDKNEYLEELILEGLLGTVAEDKTYIAGTPVTLLDAQTSFASDYYSYNNSNVFKSDAGFIDDSVATDRIVAISSNYALGLKHNYKIVSRFTFNTVNNNSVNYKLKVKSAILNTNKTYFKQLTVRDNSVLVNKVSYLIDFLVVNNGMFDGNATGIANVNIGLFQDLVLEKTDLIIKQALISDDGGLVNNASSITLNEGTKFVYKAYGDVPMTVFNDITDIFDLKQNSVLDMNHASPTKVSFLNSAHTIEVLKLIEDNVKVFINSGATLYKSAGITSIITGIDNNKLYETNLNEIKILLDDTKYLEQKQLEYIDGQLLPAATPIDLVTIAKISDVKGFMANVYFEDTSSGDIYMKTWQVFYNGATLITDKFGPSETLGTLDETVMFTLNGDYVVFIGKSSATITCNITIDVTKYF